MAKLYYILIIIFIILGTLIYYNIGKSNEVLVDKKINIKMENLEKAYFAGGCFWCMEGIFESQNGVSEVYAGYIGGTELEANYSDVSSGKTGHREGVEINYDPSLISYEQLSELFWTQIDPTDEGGQFADRGFHYTTALFYNNDSEKEILENSKTSLEKSGKFDKKIATKILPFETFFKAEEAHQDYYKKSSLRYNAYKKGSGRKDFIEDNWDETIETIESEINSKKPEIINKNEIKNQTKINNKVKKGYIDYEDNILNTLYQENIVLFFHATWCPTCKSFEEKVLEQEIPENIVIVKVDFDSNLELRKKYNIVTQTSFVLIDKEGNLKKRWIGGRGIEDVIKKIGNQNTSEKTKTYSKEELKKRLTPLQYKVTQEGGTEPPFKNAYWDNKEEGIYVDIIDRSPLFSSTDKFESGTGWPSFTKPIDDNFITEEEDNSFLMERTEIKSDKSHLGHVFNDGPAETGGQRYCINSAALDFIPKSELKGTQYEKYLELFN